MSTWSILKPQFLILRGILSIVFGLLAFAWPGPSLLAIALLWGAYAFTDGIAAISIGIGRGGRRDSWGLLVFEGVLGILAGVLTFLRPGMTLFALSILVGVWALVTGVIEILAAFSLGSVALQVSAFGRFLLGLAGSLSVALGIAIFGSPAVGAIALLTLVATYSLLFGGVTLSLGVRLQREARAQTDEPQQLRRAA